MERNEERAYQAAKAVCTYKGWTALNGPFQAPTYDAKEVEWEEALSDLVCDLRHLADREGIEWGTVLRRASGHYVEEIDGGEEGGTRLRPSSEVKDSRDPLVHVWLTSEAGGLGYETTSGVIVVCTDYDAYESEGDYTLQDLAGHLEELKQLPDYFGSKGPAIASMLELIEAKVADAKEALT